jgi:glutaredoxin-related protein
MTARKVLDPARIDSSALDAMNARHADVVREVETALGENAVVVVGMAQNPHVKKARQALTDAGISFKYLEYGSYFSGWKKRLALKLWSGWPTFPQVYANGVLLGGNTETRAALANGTLRGSVAAS